MNQIINQMNLFYSLYIPNLVNRFYCFLGFSMNIHFLLYIKEHLPFFTKKLVEIVKIIIKNFAVSFLEMSYYYQKNYHFV